MSGAAAKQSLWQRAKDGENRREPLTDAYEFFPRKSSTLGVPLFELQSGRHPEEPVGLIQYINYGKLTGECKLELTL